MSNNMKNVVYYVLMTVVTGGVCFLAIAMFGEILETTTMATLAETLFTKGVVAYAVVAAFLIECVIDPIVIKLLFGNGDS